MSRASLKVIFSVFVFLPVVALAQAKNNKATRNDDTLMSSLSTGGSAQGLDALKGLSIFAAYDLNDSLQVSGSQNMSTDRTVVLGSQYEFNQFSPGIATQIGGTFELERNVKNTNGLKYGVWTTFGEVTAKLTPAIKLMGGLNYNFPKLSNAAPGAEIKGKVGFQIGASFQVAKNFALDGRYRTLEMETSGRDPNTGATSSTGIKAQGLILHGRFVF